MVRVVSLNVGAMGRRHTIGLNMDPAYGHAYSLYGDDQRQLAPVGAQRQTELADEAKPQLSATKKEQLLAASRKRDAKRRATTARNKRKGGR